MGDLLPFLGAGRVDRTQYHTGPYFPFDNAPRTAGELRFDPLPEPRLVCKPNGTFWMLDGYHVDARGRRVYARLWPAPVAHPPGDLSPIDGKGPL